MLPRFPRSIACQFLRGDLIYLEDQCWFSLCRVDLDQAEQIWIMVHSACAESLATFVVRVRAIWSAVQNLGAEAPFISCAELHSAWQAFVCRKLSTCDVFLSYCYKWSRFWS